MNEEAQKILIEEIVQKTVLRFTIYPKEICSEFTFSNGKKINIAAC